MSENAELPSIYYVKDSFNKESWHYALNEASAVAAHKVHW